MARALTILAKARCRHRQAADWLRLKRDGAGAETSGRCASGGLRAANRRRHLGCPCVPKEVEIGDFGGCWSSPSQCGPADRELLLEAEARGREPHELLHLICIVERIRNALTNPEEPGRHYWHRHRGFPEVDGRPFALVPGWAHPAVSARVTTPNYRCRWRSKNRANSSNVSFVSGAV
jgi:hypothetical protein